MRIRDDESKDFERAFLKAQQIISATPGNLSHELHRCLERESEYVLLVRWQSVEAHEVGFRGSARYQEWKELLHHYYDPFPTVLHYEPVAGAIGTSSGSGSQ